MRHNPKLVGNRAVISDVQKALLSAPNFIASLGLTEEDVINMVQPEGGPRITKSLKTPLFPVGKGHYAHAFTLPDGGILKITDDEDDADASNLIRRANAAGEFPEGLLHVREVKQFSGRFTENETEDSSAPHPLFAIVSETVVPLRPYVQRVLAGLPAAAESPLKSFLGAMVIGNVWTLQEAANDPGLGLDFRHFATSIMEAEPSLAEMLNEVMQGVKWLSERGFTVIDLHAGNFGRAAGNRTVLFDFGHGSRSDTTDVKPPKVATNPMVPNKKTSMTKVKAAFNEFFKQVEESFPDFGTLELHHDEKAGGDNGHGSERQFGYCMDGKPIRIAFAAKTNDLPEGNIRGLMAHEFGHAIDFRYGADLERVIGRRLPKGVERRADAIAQAVFGHTIKYDDRDIQCISCSGTSPRPRRLGA